MHRSIVFAAALIPALSAAQQPTLSPAVRQFVSVSEPVVALRGVRLIDGTGTPARDNQTIVIEGTQIKAVGPAGSVQIPANARVLDLAGHTVIPGLVGLHDHMYYSSRPQIVSYPRLFLAAGVTTIRTTGSYDSYQELNIKRNIEEGRVAGPTIYVTGPYLQGPGGPVGTMHPLSGPEDARRMVKYWAEEGVSWFKAYTTISRADLGAAIDEAHKHGVKVTAHLCSVGFREAVALGIDNLEHGLLTNSEYHPQKQPDRCANTTDSMYAALDINSADVQRTFKEMVDKNVAMTSTLAVMELSAPTRVPYDQRVVDALFPESREAVLRYYARAKDAPSDNHARAALKKAMEFERAFVKAGGLLAAGSDPCCLTAIAGYADQRNFELLVEAGFSPEEAIRIMTWNGAKVLGGGDRFGTVQPGKTADLVVLRGDPTRNPADIKNTVTVFRHGIGYDSAKLTEAIKGRIGIY
jgi:imidazolonepropionase-like amidohydrolase